MSQQFQCASCKGVYFDATAEGATYHHVCPPLVPDASDAQTKAYNPRSENIAPVGFGRAPSIVAEGLGVKCVSNPKLTEPAWITQLKARQAKEEEE